MLSVMTMSLDPDGSASLVCWPKRDTDALTPRFKDHTRTNDAADIAKAPTRDAQAVAVNEGIYRLRRQRLRGEACRAHFAERLLRRSGRRRSTLKTPGHGIQVARQRTTSRWSTLRSASGQNGRSSDFRGKLATAGIPEVQMRLADVNLVVPR